MRFQRLRGSVRSVRSMVVVHLGDLETELREAIDIAISEGRDADDR
jgi:hypothetical protein